MDLLLLIILEKLNFWLIWLISLSTSLYLLSSFSFTFWTWRNDSSLLSKSSFIVLYSIMFLWFRNSCDNLSIFLTLSFIKSVKTIEGLSLSANLYSLEISPISSSIRLRESKVIFCSSIFNINSFLRVDSSSFFLVRALFSLSNCSKFKPENLTSDCSSNCCAIWPFLFFNAKYCCRFSILYFRLFILKSIWVGSKLKYSFTYREWPSRLWSLLWISLYWFSKSDIVNWSCPISFCLLLTCSSSSRVCLLCLPILSAVILLCWSKCAILLSKCTETFKTLWLHTGQLFSNSLWLFTNLEASRTISINNSISLSELFESSSEFKSIILFWWLVISSSLCLIFCLNSSIDFGTLSLFCNNWLYSPILDKV